MSLSEVINVSRYEDPTWLQFHEELEGHSTDKHVFIHTGGEIYRKGWEWTHCIYGLSTLGVITKDARALGVGAGREPVIFWLADHIKEVVATDLYGNETWSGQDGNYGNEAPRDILEDASKYSPKPIARERIRFENADGTSLQYEDQSFDFCWSLSSIEHFGGHNASCKAVQEMARVTKMGGIVCIATEYLLLDDTPHDEYFTKQQIIDYLINATPDLELVDGMSWELPPLPYLLDQICFSSDGVHRLRRHVILNDGHHQWTSFMIFMRKI
ncbi:class I SAM-dependent methyltransferase [Brucella anthropi]|uniref:class I SAM-dependent methyltransferase n=1 Tax=Brucella anthropi TaxID=529 RepID=UPI0021585B29|nr:class I SAM-dependent methyltransferase [Brucella anthropi]MCR8494111.1 class I SAM-dependent methyltransferase [Brucella anthropi]